MSSCFSVTKSCPALCGPMNCSVLGFPALHCLLELAQTIEPIESMMPSNHLIFCRPLLFLPSVFPNIRVFSSQSALHIRWPKYWSFSINPSSEYSGLISFRIDWLLKGLLQHHSSKASLHWCSALVQCSHPYMTTGKTIALTIQDICQQSDVSAI